MVGEFNLDLSSWIDAIMAFGSQNPILIAWRLFAGGGWVVFLIGFAYLLYKLWLNGRQGQFVSKKWKFIFLAINVPKENEQTPKAVESIFVALAGTQVSRNLVEKYWEGSIQESFTFEIVSLEGYIQYIIRTPSHFRDVIEAAIYAQYPEAEITEISDYAEEYRKLRFPNDEYKLWGTEFVLVKDYPYPIRTYSEFEHSLSAAFLDPMAALLEALSRLGPGEQVWLQLVVTPQAPPGWGEKAKKIIKELKGEDYKPPESAMEKVTKTIELAALPVKFGLEAFGFGGDQAEKKEADQWRMFRLSPGERQMFEKIQNKLSKHCFAVKYRFVYLGKKEAFGKGRGVSGVIGAIQQFNSTDGNGFKPGKLTKTGADYFFVKKRVAEKQNKLLRHYINRSNFYGEKIGNTFLSSEELASVWHFPTIAVKTASVKKVGARRVVPPTRLPYQSLPLVKPAASISPAVESATEIKTEIKEADGEKEATPIVAKGEPPTNLPFA